MKAPRSRPKVCHLTHDGSGGGGGATFSLAYFPAYLPEYDVFAIVGRDGDLAPRLEKKGVRTITVPMGRPLIALFFLPLLWFILWREKPDAVVLHGQWGGFFGAVAARAAGVRTLLYYTQFPSFYTDWDVWRIIRNRIAEDVTCGLVTKVVCQSAASRYQYLLRHLAPEDRFVHIPNGVAAPTLPEYPDRNAMRTALSLPPVEAGPLVVSISRLADQKRIDWLLQAWALVEKESPRAQLAIVGSGPLEWELRRLAMHLQLRRCHFLGARSLGFRYYQAADIGVISSLFEGHPLSLVEGMLCGCPMVGNSADGVAETIICGETGLLVPPGDTPAMAAAILKLIADPERARQMGIAARERAQKLYRLDDVMEMQLSLLRTTLADAAKEEA